jgi:hypothetical protein
MCRTKRDSSMQIGLWPIFCVQDSLKNPQT